MRFKVTIGSYWCEGTDANLNLNLFDPPKELDTAAKDRTVERQTSDEKPQKRRTSRRRGGEAQ